MLVAAVLCLCAAVTTAAVGLWTLRRPVSGEPLQQVLRSVAPTQLAAAAMLAAGGGVALAAAPGTDAVMLTVCALGAFGTMTAGCWQGAKAMARAEAVAAASGCDRACAGCTLLCS